MRKILLFQIKYYFNYDRKYNFLNENTKGMTRKNVRFIEMLNR
jgi:hypothetical protein